ncbi:hypothetical protein QTP88_004409 [Uroleucon formosanum]
MSQNLVKGNTTEAIVLKSYDCLKDNGYQHLTVNHFIQFKHPETGAHTNTVEGRVGLAHRATGRSPVGLCYKLISDKRFLRFYVELFGLYLVFTIYFIHLLATVWSCGPADFPSVHITACGAEKIREKKQKKLQIEAGSCFKIKDMFQKSFTTTNALNKNSNDDLPELKEIDNDQNNLKANETDVLNTLNKIDVIDVKNIKSLKVDSQSLDVDNKVVSDDLSNITTNVDFYEKPSKELIHQFLNYHPCQPNDIDFNTDKVYFTNKKMGDTRKWISYSLDRKSFFCWICIGFGLKDDQSIFVTGYSGVTKHFYDSIKEHEMSKTHINNLESFLINILERVIETIKMIGKRGLSYCGANEAAYTLDNNSLDHGNLLEILMLISKFDPILNNHVQKCIDKSKKIHKNKNTKGRDDLVSFFSKTTANVIIEGITKLIKQNISEEINQANFFTIQIDTTQDINVVDQCSIIVRYVNNQVHERVVSIVNCKSGKGKDMHELVSNELNKLNIDITKCIENSTDGAANMQGQYKGFTKWLTDDAPKQLHVWCYAHVLNLVISDVTQKTNESISLFSLLNKVAVFVRESYLRMNFWKNTT